MYYIIFFLVILKSVLGILDAQSNLDFYNTNILISDIKKIHLKSCQSDEDCDSYANCVRNDKIKINYCHFEFYCRTNYACLLGIPINNNFTIDEIQTKIDNNNNKTGISSDFYNGVFHLGEKSKLKMLTSVDSVNCRNSCEISSDCYSENCSNTKCCLKNEGIQEYICGPKIFINDYKSDKKIEIEKFENNTVSCKLSNYQSCKKDNECYSNVCDYSGICLDEINENQKKKFNNETIIFYIFLGLILLLILSVIFCSLYFSRKVNKRSNKGKRKHPVND